MIILVVLERFCAEKYTSCDRKLKVECPEKGKAETTLRPVSSITVTVDMHPLLLKSERVSALYTNA